MQAMLRWFAAAATRRPRTVVLVLAGLTLGFGALASTNQFEVDLTQLGGDGSDAVQAMDRIRADFEDPTAVVQVILDAGEGGDLLTHDGLALLDTAEHVALDALGDAARIGVDGGAQTRSLTTVLGGAMGGPDLDPTAVDDAHLGTTIAAVIEANPQLAALVSDDLDTAAGTARATVLVLPLDTALTQTERTEAAERVEVALADAGSRFPSTVSVTVYSTGLFTAGLLDAIRAEVPLLFALALLVVLTILLAAYRSSFDVAIGSVGLLLTVVWTLGLAALLGPAWLGVTGPLTQLVVIVPVLLVGLGIDYSMHLTARYREERASGQMAGPAASRALGTVGAALLLATATTALGFASIAAAPLAMLADFGIIVAAGVLCAFAIMGLLVPAARVWRDHGRAGGGSAVRELGLGRLMRGPARSSERVPWAGLVVAGLLAAISLVAASGLVVEFDRDDLIPEGSDVAATSTHQREVFGGGVSESTFVLVDADLTDAAVASALWAAHDELSDIEGVRTLAGRPQITSVMTLAAAASGLDPDSAPAAAEPAEMFARLRATLGDEVVDRLLTRDATTALVQLRTTVGDGGAGRLRADVERAFTPVVAAGADVTVTSEPIIIAEMSDELASFQIRSIALTLGVVLLLLTGYYGLAHRRPALGVIALIPATVSAALVLGTMRSLGISFNVLTATLTAIAIGIGVPYGVHVVNRFVEVVATNGGTDAIAATLRSTGGALTGSALTTLGAFVVLAFSGLPPIRSLGLLGGAGIAFALLAALLVEPGALVMWSRRHERRSAARPGPNAADDERSTTAIR